MKTTIGLVSMLSATGLVLYHTVMFGFNIVPQSKEEFICGCFDLGLFMFGYFKFKNND